MIPENGTKTHSFKRKRRKRKFNKAFILLIVLVYIVSRTTPILTENSGRVHTITHGTLEDRLSMEGIILRNEQGLSDSSRGLLMETGERVAKNQPITRGISSPEPGVVFDTIDGYEEKLVLKEILQAPEDYLNQVQRLREKESINQEDGLRLVTGYHWGALGTLDKERAKELMPGGKIWIESGDHRVRGTIVWTGEKENKTDAWVMVKSSEQLDSVYHDRKQEITLIKEEVEGLSVPLDAVYYQGDQAYVTRRKDGNNTEVPVNIILADEERAILSGDRFTDSQGEVHRTVSLYDEVLLNQQDSRGEEGLHE